MHTEPSSLTTTEARTLDERFNLARTEDVLGWAWERFGARAAIGTSFQGAGLVMMHLAKQNQFVFPFSPSTPDCFFPKLWNSKGGSKSFSDSR